MIDDGWEAPDSFQIAAPEGERGTEAEMDAAFELTRRQNARAEIRADAEAFEARTQRRSRYAAIKAGHHSDSRISQGGDDALKIVRFDSNVTVIDDQMIVPSQCKHLCEIADLHIGAQNIWANHQLDFVLRELLLQRLHAGDRGIVGIADTEDDFVFRIVLQAVAAKALVNFRIDSFQRFENRNWRQILC